MAERLFQDQVYVLGKDCNDASWWTRHQAGAEEGRIVSADSHTLTILGSIGGAHVKTLFVTPAAHRGTNYARAMEGFKACLERAGGKVVHIDSKGSTYAGL